MIQLTGNFKIGYQYAIEPGDKPKNKKEQADSSNSDPGSLSGFGIRCHLIPVLF